MSKRVISFEFWQWPEFKALCERLGIPRNLKTTGLTITIGPEPDSLVKVTQSYDGTDAAKDAPPKPTPPEPLTFTRE